MRKHYFILVLIVFMAGCAGDYMNAAPFQTNAVGRVCEAEIDPTPPPPKVEALTRGMSNRLGIPERATLARPRCDAATNPCPVPAKGWLVQWTHYGPGYPYRWFEFYETTNGVRGRKIGSNSIPEWRLMKTSESMQFVQCVAVDKDMPKDSSGRMK